MRTDTRTRIPNSLRKYRKTRGFKQHDVAIVLGLKSASIISRWENGRCLPKPDTMFKLAVLYRTMVDALFIEQRRKLQEEIIKAEEELLVDKHRS